MRAQRQIEACSLYSVRPYCICPQFDPLSAGATWRRSGRGRIYGSAIGGRCCRPRRDRCIQVGQWGTVHTREGRGQLDVRTLSIHLRDSFLACISKFNGGNRSIDLVRLCAVHHDRGLASQRRAVTSSRVAGLSRCTRRANVSLLSGALIPTGGEFCAYGCGGSVLGSLHASREA